MKTVLFMFFFSVFFFSFVYVPNTAAQDYNQWHLPTGAVARLGKGKIHDIQYSPNNTHLGVASSIGIWLYDAQTYQEVALLTGHKGSVLSISFSPDGRMLASGGREKIRLWDVSSGTHIKNAHRAYGFGHRRIIQF